MWFWWFMLFADLLVPVLMIVCGKMMEKHSPAKINGMIGYRTARSMKNLDTWKFAHDYCGRLWQKAGWILLFPSVVIHVPFYHSSEDRIGAVGGILCFLQCAVLILSIFSVECALKRNFTDEGIRK